MQQRVDGLEPSRPGAERVTGQRLGARFQLIDVEAELVRRSIRAHDGEGDHGLAGPAREVVDVEGHSTGHEHEFWWHHGQLAPGPEVEQGEPDPREDATALRPRPCDNECARARAEVLVVGRVAREAQRDVGLNGGRQIGRTAEEVGPGAVFALARANPRRRRRGLFGRSNAEELAQEKVFGVHRDVRLELALPPAVGFTGSARSASTAFLSEFLTSRSKDGDGGPALIALSASRRLGARTRSLIPLNDVARDDREVESRRAHDVRALERRERGVKFGSANSMVS